MEKTINAAMFLLFTYPFGVFVGITFWLFRLLSIAKVQGWENFPSWRPGVLVVSNHPSLLEPIILTGMFFHEFLFRPFKYAPWNMAEIKNFGGLLFRLFRTRMILVKRGDRPSEVRALKQAREILQSGGAMILFPEGGRTSSGGSFLFSESGKKKIREFRGGFAWLAKKTGATVLPVWVEGTDRVLPNTNRITYRHLKFWKRVVIKLGRPLHFESEDLDEITRTVEAVVLKLADQPDD